MNDLTEVIEKLTKTGRWDERAVRIAASSNFKCAYCDRDLLASVNDYKSLQEDHIVPLSKGGSRLEENIVLACRTCNYNVKSNWNPLDVCGIDSSREERVQAVREFVEKKRTSVLAEVQEFRSIVFGEAS